MMKLGFFAMCLVMTTAAACKSSTPSQPTAASNTAADGAAQTTALEWRVTNPTKDKLAVTVVVDGAPFDLGTHDSVMDNDQYATAADCIVDSPDPAKQATESRLSCDPVGAPFVATLRGQELVVTYQVWENLKPVAKEQTVKVAGTALKVAPLAKTAP